jgi:glycerate kinase
VRTLAGACAAWGAAYGLAALGARLLPGAALVARAVGLDEALKASDVVITGEGRLDHQTAAGKAPNAATAFQAGCRGFESRLPLHSPISS